jgi:hypothetical protein
MFADPSFVTSVPTGIVVEIMQNSLVLYVGLGVPDALRWSKFRKTSCLTSSMPPPGAERGG